MANHIIVVLCPILRYRTCRITGFITNAYILCSHLQTTMQNSCLRALNPVTTVTYIVLPRGIHNFETNIRMRNLEFDSILSVVMSTFV